MSEKCDFWPPARNTHESHKESNGTVFWSLRAFYFPRTPVLVYVPPILEIEAKIVHTRFDKNGQKHVRFVDP